MLIVLVYEMQTSEKHRLSDSERHALCFMREYLMEIHALRLDKPNVYLIFNFQNATIIYDILPTCPDQGRRVRYVVGRCHMETHDLELEESRA